jgi:hypothetical protein
MNKLKLTSLFVALLTLFSTTFFLFPRDFETIDVQINDLGLQLDINKLEVSGTTQLILENRNFYPITISDVDLHAILEGGIIVEIKDNENSFHFPMRMQKVITLPFKINLTIFDIIPVMRTVRKCPGNINVEVFGSVHVKALFVNGHVDIDDISHMFPCTLF